MDPRALLHQSPQETPPSSSPSAPGHYEPPPASPSSAAAPNAPSPAPSPQETPPSSSRSAPEHGEPRPASSSSASAPNVPPTPPTPRPPSPCIKIEGTSGEAHTGGATATDDDTITDEPSTQDHARSLARSTAPTISDPSPSGAVADARRSTFWRFVLPTRNPNPTLPVTNINPQPVRLSKFRRFKEWHKSCQGRLLPDGVIQVRVAVCGFAFYGIIALLSNTWDLIKDFTENNKVVVLFLIGLIWTVSTLAVPVTMSARTRMDKALSQHATRLVLLGITLHMLFNISLMLPQNVWMASKMNLWSLVASVLLLVLAIIGHGASWVQSSIYGEVEEKATEESGNNTASS